MWVPIKRSAEESPDEGDSGRVGSVEGSGAGAHAARSGSVLPVDPEGDDGFSIGAENHFISVLGGADREDAGARGPTRGTRT